MIPKPLEKETGHIR
jgi:hypothetical protein